MMPPPPPPPPQYFTQSPHVPPYLGQIQSQRLVPQFASLQNTPPQTAIRLTNTQNEIDLRLKEEWVKTPMPKAMADTGYALLHEKERAHNPHLVKQSVHPPSPPATVTSRATTERSDYDAAVADADPSETESEGDEEESTGGGAGGDGGDFEPEYSPSPVSQPEQYDAPQRSRPHRQLIPPIPKAKPTHSPVRRSSIASPQTRNRSSKHDDDAHRERVRSRYAQTEERRSDIIDVADEQVSHVEVSAVIGKRHRPGYETEYLIRWSDDIKDSWVAESLCHCPDKLAEYEHKKAKETAIISARRSLPNDANSRIIKSQRRISEPIQRNVSGSNTQRTNNNNNNNNNTRASTVPRSNSSLINNTNNNNNKVSTMNSSNEVNDIVLYNWYFSIIKDDFMFIDVEQEAARVKRYAKRHYKPTDKDRQEDADNIRIRVIVHGINQDDDEPWKSSPIKSRATLKALRSESGRVYILSGEMDTEAAQQAGWTDEGLAAFYHGAPEEWKRQLVNEIIRRREAKAAEAKSKVKSGEQARPTTKTAKPNKLSNAVKHAAAETNDETDDDVTDVTDQVVSRTSSTSRTPKPPNKKSTTKPQPKTPPKAAPSKLSKQPLIKEAKPAAKNRPTVEKPTVSERTNKRRRTSTVSLSETASGDSKRRRSLPSDSSSRRESDRVAFVPSTSSEPAFIDAVMHDAVPVSTITSTYSRRSGRAVIPTLRHWNNERAIGGVVFAGTSKAVLPEDDAGWSEREIETLVSAYYMFNPTSKAFWDDVSLTVGLRSADECRHKFEEVNPQVTAHKEPKKERTQKKEKKSEVDDAAVADTAEVDIVMAPVGDEDDDGEAIDTSVRSEEEEKENVIV